MPPAISIFWKRADVFRGGLGVGDAGAGVPDDEVDLGAHAREQREHLARVLGLVVDAAEQDVLEGDPLAGAQRDGADGLEQLRRCSTCA